MGNIEGEVTFYEEGDFFDQSVVHSDFLTRHFAGKVVHPGRRNEVLASRLSLQKLLSSTHPLVELNDLGLNEFYQLKNFSEFISISHSKNVATATISSIPHGIDIEWQARQLSPAVEKLITHPQDDLSIPVLKRWSSKEAALKKLFSEKIKIEKFSEIKISQDSFAFDKYTGKLEYFEINHNDQKVLISIAF